MLRILQLLTMGALLAALAACQPIYRKHGYIPEETDLARIIVGRDTRDSVADLVGRPSTAGLLNDVGWFYVQSHWTTKGLLPPVEDDREVVVISFAENGTVQNVEKFGLEQGKIVTLSRRVTTPNVKSAGFLRQLFGNIGGINTSQLIQ